jgi:hypothetical protein
VFVNKVHLSNILLLGYLKAIKYSTEALLLARSTNVPRDVLAALKQLTIEPEKTGLF